MKTRNKFEEYVFDFFEVDQDKIDNIIDNSEIKTQTFFDKCMVVSCKLPNGIVITESFDDIGFEDCSEEICHEICMDKITDRVWDLEKHLCAELDCYLKDYVENYVDELFWDSVSMYEPFDSWGDASCPEITY